VDDTPSSHDSDSPRRLCSDFTRELRERRVSLREAASKSHWGKTTISAACNGHNLPNRDLIRDVLSGIGVPNDEVSRWLERYDHLAGFADPREEPIAAGALVPEPSGEPRRRLPRGVLVATVGVVALLIVAVVLWLTLGGSSGSASDDHSLADSAPELRGQPHSTVVVQNMYATDSSGLYEDHSPSYLSSRPVARCANIGCKIAGTDMASGASITAVCHLQGQLLTNADTSSPGIKTNPNASASALWYEIIWPDERRGYISEVYLAPAYRGGLALPPC
jgi:hypothetical protein